MIGLQLLEIAINRSLQYNNAGDNALVQLNAVSLNLCIQLPPKPVVLEQVENMLSLPSITENDAFSFTMCFNNNSVILTEDFAKDQADLSIVGDAPSIIRWLLGNETLSGIQINGDLSQLKQVQQCLKSVDIDWEGMLADGVGDLPVAALKSAQGEIQRLRTILTSQK